MTDLKNKVALITGSTKGIGRAIAERYARLGAHIVLNYPKDKAAADDALESIKKFGVKVIAVKGDVSNVADIEHVFEEAVSVFGQINIVVANAGVELVNVPFEESTEDQFDHLFDINTKGAFFTMKCAAKHVANDGRIIYVGSSTTGYPRPGYAIYGSSKMAPHYMVQVLAQELGKKGIAVNAIIPTAIEGAGIHTVVDSDAPIKRFIENFCPMGRMGTPQDVANVAEFFASDLSSFVSGQLILVSGGGMA